jgi:D-alanine-D-alanine ligase
VKGREINVAVLDGKVLGDVEVRPAVEFYTYEAKYQRSDTQYISPARLGDAERSRLGDLALKAHNALGCHGYSRVDLILADTDRAICLEVNTLPGMTEKSLLPKIAASQGMDYVALVEKILAGASLKA